MMLQLVNDELVTQTGLVHIEVNSCGDLISSTVIIIFTCT